MTLKILKELGSLLEVHFLRSSRKPSYRCRGKSQEPEKQRAKVFIEDLIEDEELIIEKDNSMENEIYVFQKDIERLLVEEEITGKEKNLKKNKAADETTDLTEWKVVAGEVKNEIMVKGNVGKESSFTLAELKKMKDIIFEDCFYSLNNYGSTGYTHFKGVNLWKLLEYKSQISSNATSVKIISTDGYEVEFTISEVKRQDYIDETNPDKSFPMIIAWKEKGQEYYFPDASPYRLIVGQAEAGDFNHPKWISKIDRIIVE